MLKTKSQSSISSNYNLKHAHVEKSFEVRSVSKTISLDELESFRRQSKILHVSRNGLDRICAVSGRAAYN